MKRQRSYYNYEIQTQLRDDIAYYWSIWNSDTKDVINGKRLINPIGASFTNDRFNNPNSAIRLCNGSYQIPYPMNINGNYTMSAWARTDTCLPYMRIFDLSAPNLDENLMLTLCHGTHKVPSASIFSTVSTGVSVLSPNIVSLGSWNHYASVLKGSVLYLFVNGKRVAQGSVVPPRNVSRPFSFIGKRNRGTELATAEYDELKIYNRALSDLEIFAEFNGNMSYLKKLNFN